MKLRAPKWKGIKELDAQLAQIADQAAPIASKAVTAAAMRLETEWLRVAPYRPGSTVKTRKLRGGATVSSDYGHLRENIRVRVLTPRRFTEVATLVSTGDAFWGNFYEFGTARQAARPVFRPALERLKSELIEIQARVFYEGVEAAFQGRKSES